MKRIVMLGVVLVTMLISIGGCWPWWWHDHDGGGGGHHGGGGGHHYMDGGHDRDQR
jgi:hypothetical protein